MYGFWSRQSKDLTVKAMMLDHNAEELTKQDVPEIMSYLPNITGKRVLELGAGIGRFTGLLAEKAGHVIATDFVESFIEQNKKNQAHLTNIDYIVADATKLELPPSETDLVFSNWLLMYLDDEKIQQLLERMLNWLKRDGYFFCRESCFRPSGDMVTRDMPVAENPSIYRTLAHYDALFRSVTVQDPITGRSCGFESVLAKSAEVYIRYKKNHSQIVWWLQKVPRDTCGCHGYSTFQEFLDKQLYSANQILHYEKVFGRNFVSPGGKDTAEEFLEMLNLKAGERVLDVGCGIGGSIFLMAEKYGAECIGIDLSVNMINIGIERVRELPAGEKVRFEVADATKHAYAEESFDVIYSRDTILHIEDKLSLFKRLYMFLRPGGRLLISDYCCGEGDHTVAFQEYVRKKAYCLKPVTAYKKLLEDAGFINVRAMDRTEQFQRVLMTELAKCENIRDEFIDEFGENDYTYIVDRWRSKVAQCASGDQKWGVFYAEKSE